MLSLLRRELVAGERVQLLSQNVWETIVQGDADAIGILLRNLLENALNHTPPKSAVYVCILPENRIRIENDCEAIVMGIARKTEADIQFGSPISGRPRGMQVTITFVVASRPLG